MTVPSLQGEASVTERSVGRKTPHPIAGEHVICLSTLHKYTGEFSPGRSAALVRKPGWDGVRDASHLCLLALEVVELVAALAQPGQAEAVLLAQGLQLRAQLRALQAERGAVSQRGPLAVVRTETWDGTPTAAAALRLCPGTAVTGDFHLHYLGVHMYLQGTEQISVSLGVW